MCPPSQLLGCAVLAIGGYNQVRDASGTTDTSDYQGDANSEIYSLSSGLWSSSAPLLAARSAFIALNMTKRSVVTASTMREYQPNSLK